jgi:hypothetical protein
MSTKDTKFTRKSEDFSITFYCHFYFKVSADEGNFTSPSPRFQPKVMKEITATFSANSTKCHPLHCLWPNGGGGGGRGDIRIYFILNI